MAAVGRFSWNEARSSREAASLVYCFAACILGAMVMMFGPAILDLAIQTGTTVSAVGYCMGIRTFAYALGSLCGPIYDRLPGHLVMAGAIGIGGIGSILIPFTRNVYSLGAVAALQGFFLCFVDTGVNVLILWTWDGDDKMHPWMQALHFAFALGASLAPLLLRVVATAAGGHEEGEVAVAGSYNAAFYIMGVLPICLALFMVMIPSPLRRGSSPSPPADAPADGVVHATGAAPANTEPVTLLTADAAQSDGAAWSTLVPSDTAASSSTAVVEPAAPTVAAPPPGPRSLNADKWRVIIVAALMLAGYVGSEAGFGFYCTAYGVFALHMSEAEAQYLASVYWGGITLGRFLSIPISTRATPKRMLDVVTIACVVSIMLLLLSHWTGSIVLAWMGTIAYGMSMACVFPTVISLVESYFPLLGVHTTAFVVGSATGEWLLPFVIATFIGATVSAETGETIVTDPNGPGPSIVLWVVLAGTLAFVAVYQLLLREGGRVSARLQAAGEGSNKKGDSTQDVDASKKSATTDTSV